MIVTKDEKGGALNYQEVDSNFVELRDVITEISNLISDTSTLQNNVDTLTNDITNLDNETLKASNNLSDVNSLSTTRSVLEIYSKLETDNKYFKISNKLSNVNVIETRSNLGIGTNALRDFYLFTDGSEPTYTDGNNGDLWYLTSIIV